VRNITDQDSGKKITLATSRTKKLTAKVDGVTIRFVPAAVYCYTVGYNLVQGRKNLTLVEQLGRPDRSIDSAISKPHNIT
jgi:hypothetical protein